MPWFFLLWNFFLSNSSAIPKCIARRLNAPLLLQETKGVLNRVADTGFFLASHLILKIKSFLDLHPSILPFKSDFNFGLNFTMSSDVVDSLNLPVKSKSNLNYYLSSRSFDSGVVYLGGVNSVVQMRPLSTVMTSLTGSSLIAEPSRYWRGNNS